MLACAIGIFGRPNKPKEYRLPPSLKDRLLFDMTAHPIQDEDVLVVGGGDTAAEYVHYLCQQGNCVTLSYRKADFAQFNQQNHDALMAMEKTPTNFLHTLGIAFDDDGPVFDEAGVTNVAGLYLIGDLVVGTKGGSIITVFNSAVRAMNSICRHDLPCKKQPA